MLVRRFFIGFVGLALLFSLASALVGARLDSATYDEPIHLAAAWTNAQEGRILLDLEHPPLVRDLEALAVGVLPIRDFERRVDWRRLPDYYERFLYDSGPGAEAVLFRGRVPTILCLAAIVALAAFWGSRFSPLSGAIAAVLVATHPSFLAHGRLATTDVPFTLAFVAAVLAFRRLARRADLASTALAALAFGCALASKFSALVLPALVLPLLAWPAREGETSSWSIPWRRIGLGVAAMAGAFAILVGVYAFDDRKASKDERAILRSLYLRDHRAPAPLAVLERVFPPLDKYVTGLSQVIEIDRAGRLSWLDAERKQGGWPHYHLVALFAKSPLPLVALVMISLASLFYRRPREEELWLLVPAFGFLAVASRSTFALGVRHVLPVLALLILFAAARVAWLIEASRKRAALSPLSWLLAALVAGACLPAILDAPAPLGYSNVIAERPPGRPPLLLDSNLDWGQDLGRLRRWWKGEAREEPLAVVYFGGAAPRREIPGVIEPLAGSPLPVPGFLAVSRHLRWMGGTYFRVLGHPERGETLDQIIETIEGGRADVVARHVLTIGDSIDVYDLSSRAPRLDDD